jgi:hypothetical protein
VDIDEYIFIVGFDKGEENRIVQEIEGSGILGIVVGI